MLRCRRLLSHISVLYLPEVLHYLAYLSIHILWVTLLRLTCELIGDRKNVQWNATSASTTVALWRTRISMMQHTRSIMTPTHYVQVVTLPMVSPMDPEKACTAAPCTTPTTTAMGLCSEGGNNDDSEGGEDSKGEDSEG
ncbi:hypothetical protein EDB86DRAFT_2838928 [Lactarius hatsudake]|nr:hypothetical protein EDB86DRAFT_2838928 [Lactarius hatsudake]